MDICCYCKYSVVITTKGSYLNEEGEFRDYHNIEKIKVMDGGKLAEIIADNLKDENCIGFKVGDENIMIELFNPRTGVGDDIFIQIKEVNHD